MAKKKRRSKRATVQTERPVVDGITAAWASSVVTTLVCATVAAVIWLFIRSPVGHERAWLLVRYLHFRALVGAVISLILLAIIFRARRQKPPLAITLFGLIVALLPILTAFL